MDDYKLRIQDVLERCIKATDHKNGQRFRVAAERYLPTVYESAWFVPSGYSIQNVRRQLKNLSATCGAPIELDDRGGIIIVRVITEEIHEVIPFTADMCEKGKLLLGFNRLQEKVYHTWKNPHLLVAAETGWGKTEAIRILIYQLCLNHSPDELEIHIIDMKGGVSFLPFQSVPHITQVAYDIDTAYEVVKDAYNTMQYRAKRVRESGSRQGFKRFKNRIIIIDEAAQLAPAMIRDKDARKTALQIDNHIASIACIGREIGLNLIYCTQYPHSDVINSQVKINCGGRLCFHVPQAVNSFVVLDQGGAEDLTVKGRALYKTDHIEMIQVPYLVPDKGEDDNDSAWNNLLIPLKTEVIYAGKSQRTHIKGHVYSADSANETNSKLIQGEREPQQESLGIIKGVGVRKTYRGSTKGGYAEDMETHTKSQTGNGDTASSDPSIFDEM